MLLDTSGLLCAHDRGQPQHRQAFAAFRDARIRVTHSYVLAEFVALCEARRLPRMPALRFERKLRESAAVEVLYVDERLHAAAARLLQDRLDKIWSLCDAVSFVVMSEMQLQEALTTDHHFEQAGFRALLR
jgi:uncharacterized protein